MAKIYTMGEILVEIMRESDDCALDQLGTFLGPYPSGAPAIFISAAAQLGHETKIWGGIGKDRFGNVLLERLNADGVNCDHVSIVEGGATAVAFVAYDKAGDREFIYHIDGTPATAVKFNKSDAVVPDYFHVMGCSLMASNVMAKEIDSAVTYFASQGAKISFDPNIRPELLGSRTVWDIAGLVMENCSVFLPGVEELKLFSSSNVIEECVSELFGKYPKLEVILLKNGEHGSVVYTRDESIVIPVYPIGDVMDIVDPTGAGDSFDGAFICALAENMSLEDAGKYAAKAGALNCIARGPMGGNMLDIDKDFLKK